MRVVQILLLCALCGVALSTPASYLRYHTHSGNHVRQDACSDFDDDETGCTVATNHPAITCDWCDDVAKCVDEGATCPDPTPTPIPSPTPSPNPDLPSICNTAYEICCWDGTVICRSEEYLLNNFCPNSQGRFTSEYWEDDHQCCALTDEGTFATCPHGSNSGAGCCKSASECMSGNYLYLERVCDSAVGVSVALVALVAPILVAAML